MALLILVMGRLENKAKKGRLVVIGYFIFAFSGLFFLFVHDATTLIAALMLNALGAGVALPAFKTLFAKCESRGKESEQWSWFEAGNMFVAAVGAGLGGLIIGIFNFEGLFIAMAIIQFIAAFIASAIFKDA